jgi:hypothetical protein
VTRPDYLVVWSPFVVTNCAIIDVTDNRVEFDEQWGFLGHITEAPPTVSYSQRTTSHPTPMAFSSSSSTGFVASFENFLQSIFHIFASFARSGLAFVQFVFALVTDILNAAYTVVRGTVGAAFGITKGAADASYKVTKGTVNTGAHATAGVTKGAFGLLEGIIGFVTGERIPYLVNLMRRDAYLLS